MSKNLSNNKVIAIVGPTASGKTAYSIELAKKIDAEIISADSRLVYKDFNIGTAKPTKAEQDGISHYMIDIVEPSFNFVRQNYTVTFSANVYINDVKQDDQVIADVSGAPDWGYEFVELGDNQFSIKCKKVTQVPLMVTFTSGNLTESILVELKSMF